MRMKDLIDQANALPVEERARMVDSLLRSLNSTDSEIDRRWAAVVQRRLSEMRSGEVEPIPGNEVFEKIWRRFEE